MKTRTTSHSTFASNNTLCLTNSKIVYCLVWLFLFCSLLFYAFCFCFFLVLFGVIFGFVLFGWFLLPPPPPFFWGGRGGLVVFFFFNLGCMQTYDSYFYLPFSPFSCLLPCLSFVVVCSFFHCLLFFFLFFLILFWFLTFWGSIFV